MNQKPLFLFRHWILYPKPLSFTKIVVSWWYAFYSGGWYFTEIDSNSWAKNNKILLFISKRVFLLKRRSIYIYLYFINIWFFRYIEHGDVPIFFDSAIFHISRQISWDRVRTSLFVSLLYCRNSEFLSFLAQLLESISVKYHPPL